MIDVKLSLWVDNQNINIGDMVEVKMMDSDKIIIGYLSYISKSVHAPYDIYIRLGFQPCNHSILITAIDYIKPYDLNTLMEDIRKGHISKGITNQQKSDYAVIAEEVCPGKRPNLAQKMVIMNILEKRKRRTITTDIGVDNENMDTPEERRAQDE